MYSRHGSLESAILSVLWDLEKDGNYSNTVLDVYNVLKEKDEEKRAYTTIKTVMDRLFEKKILYRYKPNKKFFYRTVSSKDEVIKNSLNELANRFCNGNLAELRKVLNNQIEVLDKESYAGVC